MSQKLVEIALSQYGVKEIAGERNNMTIVNYAHEAGHTWVDDDETAWCSIFVDWAAMKAGLERTHKANARSWLNVGEVPAYPQMGDIVIFRRGNSNWQGHVGIFINIDEDGLINVLGGNQGNQVSIRLYRDKDLLGFRRLKEIK
nr:TIGR02594 family protein [uncultured Draconibacterium sp.]